MVIENKILLMFYSRNVAREQNCKFESKKKNTNYFFLGIVDKNTEKTFLC